VVLDSRSKRLLLPHLNNECDYARRVKDPDRNDQQQTKHREYYSRGQTQKLPSTAALSEQREHGHHNWNQ